jgi:hypothetical protein
LIGVHINTPRGDVVSHFPAGKAYFERDSNWQDAAYILARTNLSISQRSLET